MPILYTIVMLLILGENLRVQLFKIINMKNFLVKNWKTSLAGIAIAVAAFLKAKGVIDGDTLTLILSVLGSIGLIIAKDGDQTGLAQ